MYIQMNTVNNFLKINSQYLAQQKKKAQSAKYLLWRVIGQIETHCINKLEACIRILLKTNKPSELAILFLHE